MENKIYIMETSAFVTEKNASLMHIVELFETGSENIYLVDSQGRYRWRAAQRGKSRILEKGNFNYQILMYPLEPIVFVNEIDNDSHADLVRAGKLLFARNSEANEFPIVNRGGVIVRVARTKATDDKSINWDNIPLEIVLSQLQSKNIYVSSRKNPYIASFLSRYGESLKVNDLSASNMREAFSDGGVLIYDNDVFPDCTKISVKTLLEKCKREITIRNFSRDCVLGKDWISLKLSENITLSSLLKFYDECYQAVHFEDDEGKYQGSLSLPKYKNSFGRSEALPTLEDLGIIYQEDEYALKKAWAEKLWGSGIHEAIFLKDCHIVSNGTFWLDGIKDLSERNLMLRHRPCWNMISNDVAREFFGVNSHVLISSEAGAMMGFKERFKNLLDVEIFDGSQMKAYLDGGFDWLVFGAGVWPQGKTKVCQGRLLYLDLLSESMRRYWQDRGVAYYACDVHEQAKNMADRQGGITRPEKPSSASVWQGLREDYVLHADYDGDELIRVIGSHRIDAPRLNDYTRTVWVTGPCIAFGESAPYGETIEAKLQERLNEAGLSWRVINCGSYGTRDYVFGDFNSLNYLMDLPVHKGDIIIHFTQYLWKSNMHFTIKNFFTTSEVFDAPEHIKGKFWNGMYPAHINKYGYAVWADFLFKKLNADFKENMEENRESKLVKPYAHLQARNKQVKNAHLREYLQELSRHRHDLRGAIVMNANPFTLGHLHLVEEARKVVDFLYVFVVEEDKSEISFKDRFAMVQKNCEGMSNVEVLPSGKYMISALTFADYFQKEAKQEETILPTKDVKLFAEAVAPVLGITKRFVGEEPFDKVTRQYNEIMKDILPDYGIDLVEIPRKESVDGMPINATQVRKWLHDGNFKECEGFLPLASLNYLKGDAFDWNK